VRVFGIELIFLLLYFPFLFSNEIGGRLERIPEEEAT
jgi:hypothetical protein